MAEYSAHQDEFRQAGASLVAISVDDAARAEPVRRELGIDFPLLCDTGRKVVVAYGLLNRLENGGIAIPAAFVIDRDKVIRFRALESVASRLNVAELLALVRTVGKGGDTIAAAQPRKRGIFPGAMFLRAIMNALTRGVRVPWSS